MKLKSVYFILFLAILLYLPNWSAISLKSTDTNPAIIIINSNNIKDMQVERVESIEKKGEQISLKLKNKTNRIVTINENIIGYEKAQNQLKETQRQINELEQGQFLVKILTLEASLEPLIFDLETQKYKFEKYILSIYESDYTFSDLMFVKRYKDKYLKALKILNDIKTIIKENETKDLKSRNIEKYISILSSYKFIDEKINDQIQKLQTINPIKNDEEPKAIISKLESEFKSSSLKISEYVINKKYLEDQYKQIEGRISYYNTEQYIKSLKLKNPPRFENNGESLIPESENLYNKRIFDLHTIAINDATEERKRLRKKIEQQIKELNHLCVIALDNRNKLINENIYFNGRVYIEKEKLYSIMGDKEKATKCIASLCVNYIYTPGILLDSKEATLLLYKEKYPNLFRLLIENNS